MLQQLGNTFLGNAHRGPQVLANAGDDVAREPFNLLRSFAWLSLASILVIGVASDIMVLRYMTNRILSREAQITQEFIQSVVDTSQDDRAARGTNLAELANKGEHVTALLEEIAHIPDVVRANVYAPNGQLVWSTQKNLIGKHFEFNDELEEALRGEQVFHFARVSETNKAEHAFFAEGVTDFVETYVPIYNLDHNRIIGVAEIYRVPDTLFRALARARLIVIASGFGVGLLLYALLFWVVRRGSQMIARQQDSLQSKIEEHKRDRHALKRSEYALRLLSGKLLGAQEQERKRIAAELHDGLGQSLSAIKFNLESSVNELTPCASQCGGLEMVQQSITKVRDAVEEVRRISMDLRPSILDDLGILATIEWFCREYQKFYPHIALNKQVAIAENDIPEPLKVVIYRIMQEAFNNIAKHASADRVNLALAKEAQHIILSISDDGRGFDMKQHGNGSGQYRGLGLHSMRERAELSGGVFHINTHPGEGTKIRAQWPSGRTRRDE